MSNKHTPGPWYPMEYAGHINLQTTDEYTLDSDVLEADCVGIDMMYHNGKLAAAAPEMLQLLKNVVNRKYNAVEDVEAFLNRIVQ